MRRRGDYYPDTMSRPARELLEMRSAWRFWVQHNHPGAAALPIQDNRGALQALALRGAQRLAADIIGAGC